MLENKPVVLAVDDQATIRQTVSSLLNELYQVKVFTSGESVLRYLEKQTADLILLDFEMQGMSGGEVLKSLQADKRNIPVIFLTGSNGGRNEAELLKLGASDYIHKPINAPVLLARIHMQLELYRYRNLLEALVDEKTEKIKQREDMALNLLARATDMRDHETGGHIYRTTEMVRIMAEYIYENPRDGYELTKSDAEDIVKSAKLHDLGKISIPDIILLKPGKLTKEEFDVIKGHTVKGAKLFDEYMEQMEDDFFLNTARDIALYHHEKWNGGGYPEGLSGENIPLSARITAIADVYDSLASKRPYKPPFSHEKSVQIIEEESGKHFDPYLVEIFLKLADEFERIAKNTE